MPASVCGLGAISGGIITPDIAPNPHMINRLWYSVVWGPFRDTTSVAWPSSWKHLNIILPNQSYASVEVVYLSVSGLLLLPKSFIRYQSLLLGGTCLTLFLFLRVFWSHTCTLCPMFSLDPSVVGFVPPSTCWRRDTIARLCAWHACVAWLATCMCRDSSWSLGRGLWPWRLIISVFNY